MAKEINVGSPQWYVNVTGITVYGVTRNYKTYTDMLRDPHPGKFGWVKDASDDPEIGSGSALYVRETTPGELVNIWTCIYKTEIMDDSEEDVWYLGWFSTPEQLILSFPEGQAGWYATIGSTTSMWMWDGATAAWVDTGAGVVTWNTVTNKPQYFPTNIDNVQGLTTVINGITNNYLLKDEAFSGQWADLQGIPSTFPPDEHRHDFAFIDNKPEFYTTNLAHVDGLDQVLNTITEAFGDYIPVPEGITVGQIPIKSTTGWGRVNLPPYQDIVVLTQDEWDDMPAHDPATLYLTVEDVLP